MFHTLISRHLSFRIQPLFFNRARYISNIEGKKGYLSLTYSGSYFTDIQKFLEEKHNANCYNYVTNVVDAAIYAYEVDNKPCLELNVFEMHPCLDTDVDVCAYNETGEAIIKCILTEYSDIKASRTNITFEPLPYKTEENE